MKETFTKEDFEALDYDDQIGIISELLFDDFIVGQTEIGFWLPEDFDLDNSDTLPEPPPEIAAEENKKFAKLIEELKDKLFSENETIEFDLETLYEEDAEED